LAGDEGEGATCLKIRNAGQSWPVGVVAWIAPHPRDRCPWIGCIVLHSDYQRQGLGSEDLRAVEQLLAAEGWEHVLTSPLLTQQWAQAFFGSLGYTPVEERLDQDKRRCVVMHKRLIGAGHASV
jgi:GNAT superfamily N-acetyltransferase